eukprot:1133524-Prymnesium_polylepis.1
MAVTTSCMRSAEALAPSAMAPSASVGARAESGLTATTTAPLVPSGTLRKRRSPLFSSRCARNGTST